QRFFSAFWEDKSWVLKWSRKSKSREYVISQAVERWPYNLVKDTIHTRREKAIDVSTGKLMGFSTWILPKSSSASEPEEEVCKLWPEARVADVDEETLRLLKKRYDIADWESDHAMDVMDQPVRELRAQLKGDKEWLTLGYLAVHPDHQRQGVESLLIESGVRAAEQIGLDIFVSSTKAGRRAYSKAGFTLVGEITQDDSERGGDGEHITAFYSKLVKE
ncbi:hypothetical protein EJ08DRAFT_598520, partial [Tothia fuscella]